MAGEMSGRPSSIAAAFKLPSSRHQSGPRRHTAAEALLHTFGVEYLIERSAAKSSVADSKILDLARALALDPLVLLLDEPAAGLGCDEIGMLEALVRDSAAAGVAVLLVEHDVAFVGRIADRVVALKRRGRVIAEGTPAEIRSHPDVPAFVLRRRRRSRGGSRPEGRTCVAPDGVTHGNAPAAGDPARPGRPGAGRDWEVRALWRLKRLSVEGLQVRYRGAWRCAPSISSSLRAAGWPSSGATAPASPASCGPSPVWCRAPPAG